MTILVTGGAGYIGSHTVHELIDAGERVVVLDNMSTGFASSLPQPLKPIVGDVGDTALVSSVIKTHNVDSIIHFAGLIVVSDSMRDPLAYYYTNAVKSRALIEIAITCGVKHFIFSSSAAVYGNPAQVPVPEDAPLTPLSPYGWSKLMTEVMLRGTSAAHDLHHVILRYFNVAGADSKLRTGQSTPGATHLIKVAVQTALGLRDDMSVFGTDYPTPDGTCIRDYIHVTDVARAHSAALAYLRRGGESSTLNCGYGHGYSVLQVIDAVKRASGRNFDVRMAARRPGDVTSVIAEASRIRKVLGWKPDYDNLDTIIGHSLAWEHHLLATETSNARVR